MSANQICIVLTATPFIILIWDICKLRYKKRKLKKKKQVIQSPIKKYKLKDLSMYKPVGMNLIKNSTTEV